MTLLHQDIEGFPGGILFRFLLILPHSGAAPAAIDDHFDGKRTIVVGAFFADDNIAGDSLPV